MHSRMATCEAMKPAPPVIRMFFGVNEPEGDEVRGPRCDPLPVPFSILDGEPVIGALLECVAVAFDVRAPLLL